MFSFSPVQLSKCRQGVGRKLDVNRGGILASRRVTVSEGQGSLECGQGHVYSDCPRNLNPVGRREIRTLGGEGQRTGGRISGQEEPAGLKDSWNPGSRDGNRKIGSDGQSELLESES